jgi:hypothetical protein
MKLIRFALVTVMETQAKELDVIRQRILKLRKGEEGGEEEEKGGLIYSNIPSYDNSIIVLSNPMSSGTIIAFATNLTKSNQIQPAITCHLRGDTHVDIFGGFSNLFLFFFLLLA